MRKYLFCLSVFFILSTAALADALPSRALFVSVVQDPPVLTSRAAIIQLVTFAKDSRIKTLFVQVYHSGQAWFPSKVVDDSPYQSSLKTVGTDPLALLLRQAHAQGMEVHAWLNLMSLGVNAQAVFLKKYGTEILTRNLEEKKKIEDYKIDDQYFLEPGDPRVRADLAKVVKELLHRYPDLDGVQFDYIRYPDLHPHYGYTKANTSRFKQARGLKTIDEDSAAWKDWKRDQVTQTVRGLSRLARAMHPHIHVSTTGCMPYARAHDEAFQDWASWVSGGLIDFVTIMDYSTDISQFERWISVVKEKTGDLAKVKIAVGAYKTVDTPAIFEQEYQRCEAMGTTCAVFHYGSVLMSPEFQAFLKGQK